MESPDTFIAVSTRWGSDYQGALERALEWFEQNYPDQKPSVILLHPDAPEIEVPEGMKVIRKRSTPQGEVWIG